MKKVFDAVNELKGDLDNSWLFGGSENVLMYVISNITNNDSPWVCSMNKETTIRAGGKYICTVEEFNKCVFDMSNNFGSASQLWLRRWQQAHILEFRANPIKQKYDTKSTGVEFELIEEVKPEIDWSKAPDDCIGAIEHKEDSPYKDDPHPEGVFVNLAVGGYAVGGYAYCGYPSTHPIMKYFNFIPRPEIKTEYTKEMADAGELPGVGMECLIMYSSSNYKGTITYMGKGVGVYHSKDNDKAYTFALSDVTFKALKPKVLLGDGKAYQFDTDIHNGVSGIYSELDGKFFVINGKYALVKTCTNIILLTP